MCFIKLNMNFFNQNYFINGEFYGEFLTKSLTNEH